MILSIGYFTEFFAIMSLVLNLEKRCAQMFLSFTPSVLLFYLKGNLKWQVWSISFVAVVQPFFSFSQILLSYHFLL